MEPFYFGPSERPLFGVYHPPSAGDDRDTGVVLAHPMGQEYIRSHRAFRQLALQLAAAGFHVLRFDFSGCGDSGGSFEESDFGRWTEDLATALDELREGSAASRTCLLGLRLGGSLAAVVAANEGSVDGFVAWDCVIDGRVYLEQVRARHKEWMQHSYARAHPSRSHPAMPKPAFEEAVGFPLSGALLRSFEELDLLRLDTLPAERLLVLDTRQEGSSAPLRQRLRALDGDDEYRYVEAPPVWEQHGTDFGGCTVPVPALDAIVEWACGTFS